MIKKRNKLPNIKNLVKSKMFKYAGLFLCLIAFGCGVFNHMILYLGISAIALTFGFYSIYYDVKFIKDNL